MNDRNTVPSTRPIDRSKRIGLAAAAVRLDSKGRKHAKDGRPALLQVAAAIHIRTKFRPSGNPGETRRSAAKLLPFG
jgi:hypothetical protein